MTAPDDLVQVVRDLLTGQTGMPVEEIHRLEPVYGTTVFRCTMARPFDDLGESVIVKRGRGAGEFRSEAAMMQNEIAALRFLTANELPFGPRFITCDIEAGIVVMEDLGDGPSLEDLLFDDDPRAAIDGLVAFGTALGELHAATAGHADAFLTAQGQQGSGWIGSEAVGPMGTSYRSSWEALRTSIGAHPGLPQPRDVRPDIDAMLLTLAPTAPYLAMTNGDPCPANTRFASGVLRFLDFEMATFHHALLDLTALHMPFPACPCWSLMPDDAAAPAIQAWRDAFVRHHPGVLDDEEYFAGVAAACLARAIVRSLRWTRLDAADEPHPVGFTKRAQLVATIDAAVRVAQRSEALSALTAWFAVLSEALKVRWSTAPLPRTVFPAFAIACPDLRPGMLPPVPDSEGGFRDRR